MRLSGVVLLGFLLFGGLHAHGFSGVHREFTVQWAGDDSDRIQQCLLQQQEVSDVARSYSMRFVLPSRGTVYSMESVYPEEGVVFSMVTPPRMGNGELTRLDRDSSVPQVIFGQSFSFRTASD